MLFVIIILSVVLVFVFGFYLLTFSPYKNLRFRIFLLVLYIALLVFFIYGMFNGLFL